MEASNSDPGGITGWIFDVIDAFGALGLLLLNVVDTFFPPIPSEVFLPAGGYLASEGRLDPVLAWSGATAGSLIGALLLYAVGRSVGRRRIDALLAKLPLVTGDDLHRADEWFDRHGTSSVLVGRLIPGVRSLVSLPAGAAEMPMPTFVGLTTLGSGVWNGALIALGYVLGSSWGEVERYSGWIDRVLIAAAVLAVGRFVWQRRKRPGAGH